MEVTQMLGYQKERASYTLDTYNFMILHTSIIMILSRFLLLLEDIFIFLKLFTVATG